MIIYFLVDLSIKLSFEDDHLIFNQNTHQNFTDLRVNFSVEDGHLIFCQTMHQPFD